MALFDFLFPKEPEYTEYDESIFGGQLTQEEFDRLDKEDKPNDTNR